MGKSRCDLKQAGNGPFEVKITEGFFQPRSDISLAAFRHLGVSARQYHRDIASVLPDRRGQFDAGHFRHGMVGNDEIDIVAGLQDIQSRLSRMRLEHSMTEVFKKPDGTKQHKGIVIDRENGQPCRFCFGVCGNRFLFRL